MPQRQWGCGRAGKRVLVGQSANDPSLLSCSWGPALLKHPGGTLAPRVPCTCLWVKEGRTRRLPFLRECLIHGMQVLAAPCGPRCFRAHPLGSGGLGPDSAGLGSPGSSQPGGGTQHAAATLPHLPRPVLRAEKPLSGLCAWDAHPRRFSIPRRSTYLSPSKGVGFCSP